MDSTGDAGRSSGHIRKALQIRTQDTIILMHPGDSLYPISVIRKRQG